MSERLGSYQYVDLENRPREECGVFGIYNPDPESPSETATATLVGTHANQNRGEESAGMIVASERHVSAPFKRMGHVKDLYAAYKTVAKRTRRRLSGIIGIGHNRYSTTGSSTIENAAPFRFECAGFGPIAIGHNGNITNALVLRKELVEKGYIFKSTTDSEVIGALTVDSSGVTWEEKIATALNRLKGSYSLVMCTKGVLWAARDPLGFRPLSIAEFEKNGKGGFAASSESPSFDNLGIKYQREVKPGELVKFDKTGLKSMIFAQSEEQAFCGLEIAYLMKAISRLEGEQLDTVRRYLGEKLARLHPVPSDIDCITYVPESAKQSGEGFHEATCAIQERFIPLRTSLLKDRYGAIGDGAMRGFMRPGDEKRKEVAKNNYHAMDWVIGKKIVVIDDSIIRGNTTEGVIETLREKVGYLKKMGAAKVHIRIIFPPVIGPCPFGTDINAKDKLVARELKLDINAIAEKLRGDSLAYLSVQGFQEGVNEVLGKQFGLCLGCITGKYPVRDFDANKEIFEKERTFAEVA